MRKIFPFFGIMTLLFMMFTLELNARKNQDYQRDRLEELPQNKRRPPTHTPSDNGQDRIESSVNKRGSDSRAVRKASHSSQRRVSRDRKRSSRNHRQNRKSSSLIEDQSDRPIGKPGGWRRMRNR